jgi:hypothetical protein
VVVEVVLVVDVVLVEVVLVVDVVLVEVVLVVVLVEVAAAVVVVRGDVVAGTAVVRGVVVRGRLVVDADRGAVGLVLVTAALVEGVDGPLSASAAPHADSTISATGSRRRRLIEGTPRGRREPRGT